MLQQSKAFVFLAYGKGILSRWCMLLNDPLTAVGKRDCWEVGDDNCLDMLDNNNYRIAVMILQHFYMISNFVLKGSVVYPNTHSQFSDSLDTM